MTSGIYQIKHLLTGQVYVGSSNDTRERWWGHQSDLRLGNHANGNLQRLWAGDGPEGFEFTVLELVKDLSLLIEREQAWMDLRRKTLGGLLNICPNAGTPLGFRHTEEAKRKQSLAKIGVPLAEETKLKISLASTGKVKTPEHCANLSASLKGNQLSAETKAKISATLKGKTHSAETIAKRKAAFQKTIAARRANNG